MNYDAYTIPIQNKRFTELNPLSAGHQHCAPHHFFGPAINDNFLIHYVVSGKGSFENQNGKHEVGAGNIFIICPGQMYYYVASETDPWEYIWMGFNGTLAQRLLELPEVVELSDPTVFTNILACRNTSSMREEYMAGQLFVLISELFRDRTHSPGYTDRALNYIDRNYMTNLSVERLAADMCVDRRYLTRIFKRDYGVTLKEYITKVRMAHAKTFLSDGHSVGNTATMAGYGDVFNFSKMFKKYYGVSPKSFANSGTMQT